jgi:hypothetical protein
VRGGGDHRTCPSNIHYFPVQLFRLSTQFRPDFKLFFVRTLHIPHNDKVCFEQVKVNPRFRSTSISVSPPSGCGSGAQLEPPLLVQILNRPPNLIPEQQTATSNLHTCGRQPHGAVSRLRISTLSTPSHRTLSVEVISKHDDHGMLSPAQPTPHQPRARHNTRYEGTWTPPLTPGRIFAWATSTVSAERSVVVALVISTWVRLS